MDQASPSMRLREESADITKPMYVRMFRPFIRALFRFLFHVLSRVQVEGLENVPPGGSYLAVCNHVSLYDSALLLVFWPTVMEAAGAAAVLDRPFQGMLMRLYGGLVVHRGQADRGVLEAMVAHLRGGYPVFIMPEGRRSHTPGMQPAHDGAAYVVGKTGVPVVPAAAIGTEASKEILSPFKRPTLRMVIGKPFELPPVPWKTADRKRVLKANTKRIMHAIAALLPAEYHGVYAN